MPPPNPKAEASNSQPKPRVLTPRDAKRRAVNSQKPVTEPTVHQYASLEQQKTLNNGPRLASRWHLPSAFSRLRQRFAALPYPVRQTCRALRLFVPLIPISLFFSEHVAQLVWVRGQSMTPYLNEDYDRMQTNRDLILVNLWPWGWALPWERSKRLERGMVVTFRYDSLRRTPVDCTNW